MAEPFQVLVFHQNEVVYWADCDGPMLLGRQGKGEGALTSYRLTSGERQGVWRVVIAARDEDTISREHALVEGLEGRRVRLTNLSSRVQIRTTDGTVVLPGGICELAVPLTLSLGQKVVRVQTAGEDPALALQRLAEATLPPGAYPNVVTRGTKRLGALALPRDPNVEIDSLARPLQVVMGVLQSAASDSAFFQEAARAVVDILALDSGGVLTLDDRGQWTTETVNTKTPEGEASWRPSPLILAQVRLQKRTLWVSPDQSTLDTQSLLGVQAVIAAPILDRGGEVIGALYGDRRDEDRWASPGFSRLEAMLIELLAVGIAAGLARLEQERVVGAARVQLEQFFTPKLARQLREQPDLLQGRDSEVTVLFCDIRGFSRISARLGPEKTVDWISDVLGTLSECLLEHDGVLVDYIGDELMGMWGAPKDQPDHARSACLAALEMLDRLPELDARWHDTLGEPIALGIGINTGVARVGNMGSRHKFKYGPLGNTVNLASRLQGATKYLKARLLVSETTFAQLAAEFPARRLGTVQVINIPEPVVLYELAPASQANWPALVQGYTTALDHFEGGEFRLAARLLGRLVTEHPDDSPSLVLLSRAVNALIDAPSNFDSTWELPGK
jgi:adenylate cyclase